MVFMRNLLLLLCVSLVMVVGQAYALDGPLSGEYRVTGKDPSSGEEGSYSGTLNIALEGDVYMIKGVVDEQGYIGVGLYDSSTGILSVSFESMEYGERGLGMLKWDGKRLKGRWLFVGESVGAVGTEEWTPVK